MTAYDTDYIKWIEETVELLRNQMYSAVDWENLIDEIEDMSRSEKRAIESLLLRLIEHIYKLEYWLEEKERCGNHWESEIANFQHQIERRIKNSPSLKGHLQAEYEDTLEAAKFAIEKLIKRKLPKLDLTLDEILKYNR